MMPCCCTTRIEPESLWDFLSAFFSFSLSPARKSATQHNNGCRCRHLLSSCGKRLGGNANILLAWLTNDTHTKRVRGAHGTRKSHSSLWARCWFCNCYIGHRQEDRKLFFIYISWQIKQKLNQLYRCWTKSQNISFFYLCTKPTVQATWSGFPGSWAKAADLTGWSWCCVWVWWQERKGVTFAWMLFTKRMICRELEMCGVDRQDRKSVV